MDIVIFDRMTPLRNLSPAQYHHQLHRQQQARRYCSHHRTTITILWMVRIQLSETGNLRNKRLNTETTDDLLNSESSTGSVSSSIRHYREVHGRTFHNYGNTEYWYEHDWRHSSSFHIAYEFSGAQTMRLRTNNSTLGELTDYNTELTLATEQSTDITCAPSFSIISYI